MNGTQRYRIKGAFSELRAATCGRLQEGCKINTSLSILGRVIQLLGDKQCVCLQPLNPASPAAGSTRRVCTTCPCRPHDRATPAPGAITVRTGTCPHLHRTSPRLWSGPPTSAPGPSTSAPGPRLVCTGTSVPQVPRAHPVPRLEAHAAAAAVARRQLADALRLHDLLVEGQLRHDARDAEARPAHVPTSSGAATSGHDLAACAPRRGHIKTAQGGATSADRAASAQEPHPRRDLTTSAPGPDHICTGTGVYYCRRFASRAQQVQNVVKVNCISENPPACAADAEARAKRVRSFGLRGLLVAFSGTNRPD